MMQFQKNRKATRNGTCSLRIQFNIKKNVFFVTCIVCFSQQCSKNPSKLHIHGNKCYSSILISRVYMPISEWICLSWKSSWNFCKNRVGA